jgi:transcriptional regulator with XRE-family HTH domain
VSSSKNCIAKRLREARLAFGISQKKLGILAGIDEHSASARMNQYEMGKHIPNFLTLQHIGNALGYPVSFFSSEDDLIAEVIHVIGKLGDSDKRKVLNFAKTLALNKNWNGSLIKG